LGFSLFLSIIDDYDSNIFNEFASYQIFPKTNSNVIRPYLPLFLSNPSTNQFIKKIKGVETELFGQGKRSYIQASRVLLDAYGFEKIIDEMYKYACNPNSNSFE
jgi:hypothetical protein